MKKLDKNNPLPLYLQLREIIRNQIKTGEKTPGSLIPHEHELCRIYNVSRPTVIHALKELTNEGLLIRIKSKGTFVAGTLESKGISHNKYTRVAFIVPDIEDVFISEIYRGIADVTNSNGYKLIVFSSERRVEKEMENLEMLKEIRVDGAIIFPNWGRINAGQILKLKKDKFPFVLIDRYFRDIDTDRVTVDNTKGAYIAVMHLAKLGHKKIAHIMGTENTGNEDRLEGYRKALGKANIPYNPDLIRKISPVNYGESIRFEPDDIGGYKETKILLSKRPRATAIFAGNDYLALGAMRAVKEKKLKIPQDIALVGFDDLKFASTLEVPFTTIRQPKYEIGKSAANLLIQKIAEEELNPQPQHIVLETKLIIRKSCGARKGR